MKAVGAIMIFSACAFMGFILSDRLKKRRLYLNNMCQALNLLETEISFGASRLKRAFVKINSAADTRGLFKYVSESMEEKGIKRAWREAAEAKKAELCFKSIDTEALLTLGERLGMTDTENQVKNIAYTRRRLEECLKAAEREYETAGRLYRNGGILIGLFLVLLLI